MKKPINKFAVALWVLAIVVFIVQFASFFSVTQTLRHLGPQGGSTLIVEGGFSKTALSGLALSGLMAAAQLSALGVIIELIDQIRWNALPRSK